MNEPAESASNLSEENPDTVQLVYILYLASLLLGITALVGVVLAYMNKGDAPEWLKTHYVYLIHTFWKGLLYSVIAMILVAVLIGLILVPLVLVWWVVRCVKGLKLLGKKEPIPDPTGWLF